MAVPLPSYETSDRPWFGPTARAKKLLTTRSAVLAPEEALQLLVEDIGDSGTGVQHVRFIDFCHREKNNFRFTIALCWTDADPRLRDHLYDRAESIVAKTGWYPLPQGERLGSRRESSALFLRLVGSRPDLPSFGRLVSIENAARSLSCAIRVRTEHGNLLLDAGFPDAVAVEPKDRLVLLSHIHHDHAGGLADTDIAALPVVASEGTVRSLIRPSRFGVDEAARRFAVLMPGRERRIGQLTVSGFPVPHCPGASGFRVADGHRALYFPGDVVLRTSRHDFLADLVERVQNDPIQRRTVLLDATMAGRTEGASGEDAAESLLSAVGDARDIAVVADDHSQLLYAYLDLFFAIQNSPLRGHVSFIVSGYVRRLAQLLHDAFIARRLDQVDPLLGAQYGSRMSAWGESRWLFWLDHLRAPIDTPYRFWLVHRDDTDRVPRDAAGVTVGRTDAAALEGRRVLPVDTTPWTQHSSATTIADAAQALGAHVDVVLFHAPSRKLRRFIRDQGLSDCSPLTSQPISLTPSPVEES